MMQLLPLLPIWLVLLGGLVAALNFWTDCPRPARLALLALLLLGASMLAQPFVTNWLIVQRAAQGWTATQFGTRLAVSGLGFNLLRAVGFGLLLVAVFIGRRPGQRPPSGVDYHPSSPQPRIP